MMDLIRIRGLRVPVVIGTRPEERLARQTVEIELELGCDLAAAGASDNLRDAPDYSEIERGVYRLAAESKFQLLEKLATAVAEYTLSFPAVRRCRVALEKPGAARYARSIGIEMVREK